MNKNYVFKVGDEIKVMAVTDEAGEDFNIYELGVPYGVPYFIFNQIDLPTAPIESWELSDEGVISINQQKLIEFNRKNMPPLTPIEFDIKLVDTGLYEQVQDLISKDIKLKIAYTRATFFSRTDPFIDQARIALNLTDEQVDEMWMN